MKKLLDNIYVRAFIETLVIFILSLAIGGVITALCSCRTCKPQTEYVTDFRETVRGDTVRVERLRIDSIRVTDSIVTLIKGDTVITDRWHTAYRERVRVDTVEKIKLQTVFRTKTEVKNVEVPRRTPIWISVLATIGVGAAVLFILWLLLKIRPKS